MNRLIALCLVLAAAAPAAAHEVGFSLDLGLPAGEFGDNVDNPGFGLSGRYAHGVGGGVSLGVGLDYLIYGRDSRWVDVPLIDDVEVVTSNNIAGGYLLGRWTPVTGAVELYAEARYGLRYLWTESHIEDGDWDEDGGLAREVNESDLTSFTALGGGVRFRLSEADPDVGDPALFLDITVTAFRGGDARYLTDGGIDVDHLGRVLVRASESDTDLVRVEAGITLLF